MGASAFPGIPTQPLDIESCHNANFVETQEGVITACFSATISDEWSRVCNSFRIAVKLGRDVYCDSIAIVTR